MRFTRVILYCLSLPLVLRAQQPVTPGQLGAAPITRDAEATLRNNQLNYAVSYSESFDDSATSSSGAHHSFTSSARSEIGLTIDRSRLSLSAHYAPAVSYSSNATGSNSFSQATGLDFGYSFSKRLALSAHESYIATSDPFDNLRANADLPNFGVIDRPTSSALGTNLDSKSQQLSSDITYRLNRYTSVGAGGSFGFTNYESLERNSNLGSNSRSWSASGFLAHQFTAACSAGFQYTAQWFSSTSSFASDGSGNEASGFLNVSLNRSVHVGFFGGPNLLHIDRAPGLNALVNSSHTAISGGASFNWQGEHNGMVIDFTQRASNGGISTVGVVNMRSAGLSLQRRLTRAWVANGFARYNTELPIASSELPALADSVSIGGAVSRALGQRLTLTFTASRQQFIGRIPVLFSQRSHDIVGISVSYRNSRPIGR